MSPSSGSFSLPLPLPLSPSPPPPSLSHRDYLTRSYYGIAGTLNMSNVDGIFEAELKPALGNRVLTL